MPFVRSSISILLFAMISWHGPVAIAQNSKENADFKLALNLYNDGMYELAAEQLKQFIGAYPSTDQGIEARFYLGLAQMKLKQYEDARLTFQTFALTYQDNPKAPEAWWNVGDAYAALGNKKEAALAYERVKVFHPRSPAAPDALVEAAKYFKLAGQNDDARRVLRIVLQEYSSSASVQKARTALGEIYFQEGNFVQAQNELTRVIEGDPSAEARSQALLVLGDVYMAQWRVDQARGRYEEIIAKHKDSPARLIAYVRLGKVNMGSGKYSEAVTNFSKALAEKSQLDSTVAYEAGRGLGDAYAALNDQTKAIHQYEQVLASLGSDPRSAEILWRIADSQRKAKNYSRATQTLKKILASDPPDDVKRRALVTLGQNAEDAGSYAEAVRTYGSFLESYANDPFAPLVLKRGAMLSKTRLNDPRRAALLCELSISRFPRSPYVTQAYLLAADCYEQLKDVERSIDLRRELLEKYPSAESTAVAREKIRSLETFEAKDKDAAVEKLAILLGDVFAEHEKGDLAFQLGETYFKDLKNYSAAAAQFTTVINSGITDKRFEQSLFLRARSYEYLSWRDPSYRRQAIKAYEVFLEAYPSEPNSDEAALSLFTMKATSVKEALAAYDTMVAAHPRTGHRGEMLLRIGTLQEKSDSAGALGTYATILRDHATSPAAQEASYRRFALLLEMGRTDSAVVEGERYSTKYPNGDHTAEVIARLGTIALMSNDPARAVELFSTLLNEFEYTAAASDAKQHLAESYALEGKFDESISTYNEIVDLERTNPFSDGNPDGELLLAQAKVYRSAGKPSGARKALFNLLEQEPKASLTGEVYGLLGSLAKDEGDIALATAYFQQAGAASPDVATTREVADLLFEAGAYADAVHQYKLLAASSKSETDKKYLEAQTIRALLRSDDLQNAQKAMTAFSKKYKDSAEDLASFELEKGNYFFRKEDYKSARSTYDIVKNKYDATASAADAMYWTGKVLEATDKPKDAVKEFENLLKEYPSSPILPRARLALGNISYNSERWDDAIKHYKSVVDDRSVDASLLPFAMSNLIEAYEAAGIFDAALDWTRKYLDRFPSSEDSFDKKIKIGILYQRLGYYDQSIVHLQSLIDEAGSELEGEIRYYIAEANFQKGDFQQAILDYLKVPYLVTKKGKIDWTANSLYMAGQSYEKLGRHDQALAMYQQIIDRSGIDETFKAAAKKEIDRVKLVLKKSE